MDNKPNIANVYVRKYVLKVLARLAKDLGHAEDGIAALTHSGSVQEFISHARTGQGVNRLHEVSHPKNSDAAIELAFVITQADDHVGSTEVWIDHFFNALKKCSVVIQGCDAIDQFSLHDYLSKLEGVDFGYALKYAAKLCGGLNQQGGAA